MDTTNHCQNCEAMAKEIESLRAAIAVKDEALAAAEDWAAGADAAGGY